MSPLVSGVDGQLPAPPGGGAGVVVAPIGLLAGVLSAAVVHGAGGMAAAAGIAALGAGCAHLVLSTARAGRRAAPARRRPLLGVEAMPGLPGEARSAFVRGAGRFEGMVLVAGARWQAVAEVPIADGAPIRVLRVLAGPTRLGVAPA